jgi:hypothetical protein
VKKPTTSVCVRFIPVRTPLSLPRRGGRLLTLLLWAVALVPVRLLGWRLGIAMRIVLIDLDDGGGRRHAVDRHVRDDSDETIRAEAPDS